MAPPPTSPFAGAARWVGSWVIVSVVTVTATIHVRAAAAPTGEAVAVTTTTTSEPSPVTPPRCANANHVVDGFAPTVSDLTDRQRAAVASIAASAEGVDCVSDGATGSASVCLGGLRAAVIGHADANPSGRTGGNEALSLARAAAVGGELAGLGLLLSDVEGVGSTRPAATPSPDNRSPEERLADDRRVEVRLHCAD